MSVLRPVRLSPDNFTPPSRTPWGGTRLLDRYKAGLGIGRSLVDRRVGESWELSVSEEFESRIESGHSLRNWIRQDVEAALGDEAHGPDALTSLLVKWLDAAEPLSLQIHPHADYLGMKSDESGKLEAWYVVDHDPAAGLYLGFRDGVRERDVREALASGHDLSALMAFIPVARGDFVLLEPGTPHAIGKGLNLIEPQVGVPRKRALTYRYWDWGRRYRADGVPDPAGRPRDLHISDALAVTRWDRACDASWLASRRIARPFRDASAPALLELLAGPEDDSALHCAPMRVARMSGTGVCSLPRWNALRAVTLIEGGATLGRGADALALAPGTTAAVPASAGALEVTLDGGHLIVSAAVG